jgi:hypothetical protein
MSRTPSPKIEIGDEVTFNGGARGRHKGMQTGIVIGFHYKEFRGRRKELNQMYGGESGVEVLKIQSGTTIWKIGRSLVQLVRKAAVERQEAVRKGTERTAEIRQYNRAMQDHQKNENFDVMEQTGIHRLNIGDRIEVQLHDRNGIHRWYPAFFNGIVRATGKIKIRQTAFSGPDRLFSTAAKYVRIPESTTGNPAT